MVHHINIALRVLLLTNSLVLLAGFMLGPIYALFVKEIGGDIFDAGLTMGIFALAGALTTLVSGAYADKIKENELIIVLGYFIMGVGFFLYNFASSVWILLLIEALLGIGEAIYSPVFSAIYSKHLSKNNQGKEWSLWDVAWYVTSAIGAVLGAWLASVFGFGILFTIMSVLCLSSALYIYALPRKVL